ncbi:MAG TPA: DUF4256 domain-containing protein [Ferruginibacter sp.]|nr:DUF4256 domain-containing protein [Ferruginibacter sp.]HMP20214.1 DUF4256 domain-containing protein [Ferruginibacter sp.]
MKNNNNQLTAAQTQSLLALLQTRFEKNMHRHKALHWADVLNKIETHNTKNGNPKLFSLYQMEQTGGEPDVVQYDKKTGSYFFYDCAAETPAGRRSTCYDEEALESRKEHKPANSATGMAAAMGIALLTEEQYRHLQQLEAVDQKTSSWIHTPAAIRKLGGALFCDRRYNQVFVYHNGAQSYYAARGFRAVLEI